MRVDQEELVQVAVSPVVKHLRHQCPLDRDFHEHGLTVDTEPLTPEGSPETHGPSMPAQLAHVPLAQKLPQVALCQHSAAVLEPAI